MAILEADGIRLNFGLKNILTDVYFKCQTGQLTGLLGRNGTGKSCLMKIVFGCLKPENKSVRIDGIFINEPFRKKGCITMLPQTFFIPPSLHVKSVFHDFSLDFDEFCGIFPDLGADRKTRVGRLSGGQRRLLEAYVIIKSKSKFSLLDEPFTHLMPLHTEKLIQLLHAEKEKKGFLISDHLYRIIVSETNRLYLLKNGKTHLVSDPKDLSRLGYIHDSED